YWNGLYGRGHVRRHLDPDTTADSADEAGVHQRPLFEGFEFQPQRTLPRDGLAATGGQIQGGFQPFHEALHRHSPSLPLGEASQRLGFRSHRRSILHPPNRRRRARRTKIQKDLWTGAGRVRIPRNGEDMAETDRFTELIRRIRAGDDQAALELVRSYEPLIR